MYQYVALPARASLHSARTAEHGDVELGGDEDEDVVAEEGELRAELRLRLLEPRLALGAHLLQVHLRGADLRVAHLAH